jgi:cytochrome c biogenesis protein CcmG, thiol:disulfide interchange protein DsbE
MNSHPPHSSETSSTAVTRRRPATAAFVFFFTIGLAVLTVIVVVLVSRRYTAVGSDGTKHRSVERLLSQMQLLPLNGGRQISLEDVRGRVVLVNYWGSWCAPCRDEFPYMLKLYEEFKDHPDFQMLSVSCEDDLEQNELERKTREFLRQTGWEGLPTYTDPRHTSRTLLAILAELGTHFPYPTTVILDREAAVGGLWESYQASRAEEIYQEQRRLIAQLLATGPPPTRDE